MSSHSANSILLVPLLALIVGCNDSPWEAETRFEQALSCATSLTTVKELAQTFQMTSKEVPFQDQTNAGTSGNLLLMLFKDNNAYSFSFKNGKIVLAQKQTFRTWGIGNGIKETISVKSLFECDGDT